jgi:4-hydroxybenzoate polyprenyltransferase
MMRARWMIAWLNERFPLRNGLFFVLLYVTTVLVARMSVSATAVSLTARDVVGVAALWSFFLVLRVFDEHKDFAADAIAHPDRILQRGFVTLPQLRLLGASAVAFQAAASLWFDGGIGTTTLWWAAAMLWSVLMAREFFVSRWLRRHLVIYALSHMAVMLLLVGWVASIGDHAAWREPIVWSLGGLVFLAGLVFEVARKIRAPDDERPMADSYTRALGTRGAPALLAALGVAASLAAVLLVRRIAAPSMVGPVAVGVLTSLTVLAAARFAVRPTRRHAKLAEAVAGLSIIAAHAMVVAAVLSVRSIVWR